MITFQRTTITEAAVMMNPNLIFLFPYLTNELAEEAYIKKEPVRGYFETEDAWIGFDFTEGISVDSQFLLEWQAKAFAATDLDTDDIWNMSSQEWNQTLKEVIRYRCSER